MSKQEEIIKIAGKNVVARYSNDSHDCCGRCTFWANICTAEDDMMRIPCQKHDKDGKYAYFVLVDRPKPTIITQKSPANNTDAGLEAEIDREIQKLHTAPCYDELQNFAHHFIELGRKKVLQEIHDGEYKVADKHTVAYLKVKTKEFND